MVSDGDTDSDRKPRGRWINPKLVPLKVSLFLIFGATSALIPYLTIHMQSIGLTVREVASVYLTLLFTSCLSPPLTGFLIDRFGRYKPVLLSSIVLNMVAHHIIHFIPSRGDTFALHNITLLHGDGSVRMESLFTGCPDARRLEAMCASIDQNTTLEVPILFLTDNGNTSCGLHQVRQCSPDEPHHRHPGAFLSETVPAGSEYDRTFWMYLVVRFVATSMLASTLTITDPIALDMIKQHGGDFGREKLYSSVGMAIFTPMTGLLIDVFSRGHPHTVYTPAFYTYDVLLLCSLVSVWLMPIGAKEPTENVLHDLGRLLRRPHLLAFLAFLFLLGNFWGFIESYLFVIMTAMHSPNYLLGLTYTVGTVASIPMMFLLERITRRVGHVNLLVVAFFAHALRILGYSWITNPFWCFPIELNEAISCYFMWVVATTYCAVLAPSTLVATLIGVAGMVHFCLGKGIGSFVGGLLIQHVGLQLAFRYVGYTAAGCGVLYKAVHLAWLHQYDDDDRPTGQQAPEGALGELVKRRASILPKVDQFGSAVSFTQQQQQKTASVADEEMVPLGGGKTVPS